MYTALSSLYTNDNKSNFKDKIIVNVKIMYYYYEMYYYYVQLHCSSMCVSYEASNPFYNFGKRTWHLKVFIDLIFCLKHWHSCHIFSLSNIAYEFSKNIND